MKAVCCRSKEVKKKKMESLKKQGVVVRCSEIVEIKISEVKKSGSDSWIVDGMSLMRRPSVQLAGEALIP